MTHIARGGGFGLDADLARKQAAKYDHDAERKVRIWIEMVTRVTQEGSFGSYIKNGRVLCTLINSISPGAVKKIELSSMPFKEMENISSFLKACRIIGIAEHDLFETVDLYEEKVPVYSLIFNLNIYSQILHFCFPFCSHL